MDWEQCYREGREPWEKGEAAPPLVAWLSAATVPIVGEVLVPGCGSGHDAAAIAAGSPDARVTGLDVAATPVRRATARYPLSNLHFRRGDLFSPQDVQEGGFDWVFEHTCFCAIDQDRRDEYVAAVARALKSGGHFLAVFYLDPYDDEHPRGAGPPHGVEIEELDKRFGEEFRLLESYVPAASYPGREGLELLRWMRRH